jgi:hypothetical protein
MGTPYALSSDLVSAWPAKSLAVAQYVDGYKLDTGPVQNPQTGTTYTFVLTDTTKTVTANNAAASAYTVPPQSSVVWEDYTTLRLLNLGAGVVTLTAGAGVTINGTATVAQYSSATLVRTASNMWTVAGSGAAPGMVLITPTSVAGSGVTLSGGQISFSAATSVSVNGCFSSAYQNYVIKCEGVASTTSQVAMRLRLSGADSATSIYIFNDMYRQNGTAGGSARTETSFWIGYASTTNFSGEATIYGPQLAATTKLSSLGGREDITGVETGYHNSATAYDGMTLLPLSGNITGTMRIYGLRNS